MFGKKFATKPDNEPLDKISRFTDLAQDNIVKLKNKL